MIQTPQNLKIVNQYQKINDKTDCNPFQSPNNFGNYFQSCQNPSAYWGSNKPEIEKCEPGLKAHEGLPCHSIWNNNTKRKMNIFYKR